MLRRTHRRRLAVLAAATALLAAPAANARLDEGGSAQPGPRVVRVSDADGFSWGAAAIGAGAALGAVALVGTGRAVRRHDIPAHS